MTPLLCIIGYGDRLSCACGKEFQQAVTPYGFTDCCAACWEARGVEYDNRHPDEVARREKFARLRAAGRWA